MNYLAHLSLSGEDPEIMTGNFFGDFVKGTLKDQLPQRFLQGVTLHRHIDFFADHHPLCAEARKLLFEEYRHFSGVLTDIFWDYFLSKHWSKFHEEPLHAFTVKCYDTVESLSAPFSEDAKQMLRAMRKGNWLMGYGQIEGIAHSLRGMSIRVRIANPLLGAEKALLQFEPELEALFSDFYPELQASCRDYLSNLPT